jgi:predicted N-acetyltransferase YhbS
MGGKLVGHIMYTKSKVVDNNSCEHETLTFGPLSVLPEFQNLGIGKALQQFTFGVAKRLGYRAILIFGHPDYYTRVGFRPAAEFGISTSDGINFDPFIAYPLYDGALDAIRGRYYIDPAYDGLTSEDIMEFDKKFPPKALHIPIPIEVLTLRLPPLAQKSFKAFEGKSLKYMTTKSEKEICSMDGVDEQVIKTIRTVLREHAVRWGTTSHTNGG